VIGPEVQRGFRMFLRGGTHWGDPEDEKLRDVFVDDEIEAAYFTQGTVMHNKVVFQATELPTGPVDDSVVTEEDIADLKRIGDDVTAGWYSGEYDDEIWEKEEEVVDATAAANTDSSAGEGSQVVDGGTVDPGANLQCEGVARNLETLLGEEPAAPPPQVAFHIGESARGVPRRAAFVQAAALM